MLLGVSSLTGSSPANQYTKKSLWLRAVAAGPAHATPRSTQVPSWNLRDGCEQCDRTVSRVFVLTTVRSYKRTISLVSLTLEGCGFRPPNEPGHQWCMTQWARKGIYYSFMWNSVVSPSTNISLAQKWSRNKAPKFQKFSGGSMPPDPPSVSFLRVHEPDHSKSDGYGPALAVIKLQIPQVVQNMLSSPLPSWLFQYNQWYYVTYT